MSMSDVHTTHDSQTTHNKPDENRKFSRMSATKQKNMSKVKKSAAFVRSLVAWLLPLHEKCVCVCMASVYVLARYLFRSH